LRRSRADIKPFVVWTGFLVMALIGFSYFVAAMVRLISIL